MRFETRNSLQNYLNEAIPQSGSYAIVKYKDNADSILQYRMPIWFANLGTNFNADKNNSMNWYLEMPLQLTSFKITNDRYRKFYLEDRYIIKGDVIYEIIAWQTTPFLPEIITDLKLISNEECLEYLLETQKH